MENVRCIADGSFGPVSILELTGRIIKMTEEMKDYLILPQETVLSKNVIFLDPFMRQTRICVIPVKTGVSEKESVSCLLEELKELTDSRGEAYLDVFIREYNRNHLKEEGLLSLLEDLKKEAGME